MGSKTRTSLCESKLDSVWIGRAPPPLMRCRVELGLQVSLIGTSEAPFLSFPFTNLNDRLRRRVGQDRRRGWPPIFLGRRGRADAKPGFSLHSAAVFPCFGTFYRGLRCALFSPSWARLWRRACGRSSAHS
jgi:hypothetical protein